MTLSPEKLVSVPAENSAFYCLLCSVFFVFLFIGKVNCFVLLIVL